MVGVKEVGIKLCAFFSGLLCMSSRNVAAKSSLTGLFFSYHQLVSSPQGIKGTKY